MVRLRRGRIALTEELVKDALRMPSGTSIVGARYDPVTRTIELVVEHEALHEVEVVEGAVIPRYVPTITQERIELNWDWGEPQGTS